MTVSFFIVIREAKRLQALQWAAAANISDMSGTAAAALTLSEGVQGVGEVMQMEEIYLCLLKILLSPPSTTTPLAADKNGAIVKLVASNSAPAPRAIDPHRLRLVMDAAERHCDKIDACAFLDMLPSNVPTACIVNFVSMAMESTSARQHNLQVGY